MCVTDDVAEIRVVPKRAAPLAVESIDDRGDGVCFSTIDDCGKMFLFLSIQEKSAFSTNTAYFSMLENSVALFCSFNSKNFSIRLIEDVASTAIARIMGMMLRGKRSEYAGMHVVEPDQDA